MLHHDSYERLGSGFTKEKPSHAVQFLICLIDIIQDLFLFHDLIFIIDRNILKLLRQDVKAVGEIGKYRLFIHADLSHHDGREYAVTGAGITVKNDMSRLFSAHGIVMLFVTTAVSSTS